MLIGKVLLMFWRSLMPHASGLSKRNTVKLLEDLVALYRERMSRVDSCSKPIGQEVLWGGQSHV